ncbi:MAG: aspartate aminotransferase family protein [Gammaproteobacteria bacterium]|jgi:beta-alanine--pyruvate transaminase|nr:aspartate aminotransferase family protein [Gammaproteobacteria bacterium]
MPFTHNRFFKNHPRLITAAEGAYYTLSDGRRVFDALSGLWCCPLGHSPRAIVEAVQQQVAKLDFSPSFQMGHPAAFHLAERITTLAKREGDKVFLVNSGSEAVDTALKIAVAYHRARGEASRTRIIGRERAYHGVGMGGISVGGIPANRKMFAPLMIPGVDHLPHTFEPSKMGYSRGQPEWGLHLADELERLVALHDASNIAAVIVEPMQGSTGVIVPPKGYLQRLREICTRHGILLIFDEVITGFGRLGTPFAADFFAVRPDMITFAKAVNNAAVPLGGVIVDQAIHDAFMTGPDHLIEFFHGYTYSGHPLAVAAAHAALDLLPTALPHAASLSPVLEDCVHSLRGEPLVTDIRNLGLAAAIDVAPVPGMPALRAFQVFEQALQRGLMLRFTGETLAMAPPFISTIDEIKEMTETLREALRATAALG